MRKVIFSIIVSALTTSVYADGLTQVQLSQSDSMVVLPSASIHVIGQPLQVKGIDRDTIVWFVTNPETPMEAVDELEEKERQAAIELENIRLAEAEAARLAEPVDVAHSKVQFAFKAKSVRRIVTLSEVLSMLSNYPDATVEIVGHTDSIGSDAENMALGQARAKYVSTWLQKRNVNANRISISSKGESDPEASDASPAGRKKNRRAVVTVYVKRGQLSTNSVDKPVIESAQSNVPQSESIAAQNEGTHE